MQAASRHDEAAPTGVSRAAAGDVCAPVSRIPRPSAQQTEFDIVIRGGRIVDGSGNPWFLADIGVRDGRIAAIARKLPPGGGRIVDATGKVVAPGFIDVHTHSKATSKSVRRRKILCAWA